MVNKFPVISEVGGYLALKGRKVLASKGVRTLAPSPEGA